ncbi:MAG: tRNA pseudouridine(13) synthase TruD [Deltaproteobacteria bacterium]|nr:tRNA pseudouridine(13) synthase TruD [Deltaproteobacteria bacterium]
MVEPKRPRLTRALEGSGGRLKPLPAAFVVRERLAYAPEGVGTHAFVRIEKTDLDTLQVARMLAQSLGLPPRDPGIGFAGMKDRHSVAEQWFSCPWREDLEATLGGLESASLRILEVQRHPHKLRRGHATSNWFSIEISDVPAGGLDRARAVVEALRKTGVPNAFGPQRFGRDRANADHARAWLSGEARPPRDRRLRDLFSSALQSEVFNAILSERITRDLFDRFILGDIAKKHASGGLFTVEDLETDNARAAHLEISPTGPLPGSKSRLPTGSALAFEQEVLTSFGLSENDVRRLGPGTRRPIRFPLEDCVVRASASADANVNSNSNADAGNGGPTGSYRVEVTLPSGAYATVLLDEIVKPTEGHFDRTWSQVDDS